MKLKKLLPELVSTITELGYDKDTREIQDLSMSKIKSGADFIAIGSVGSGKTTAINLGVIQQLKSEFEKAPRAIVVVENKDRAFEIDEQFEKLAKKTSLRSLMVYDEGRIMYQKDMIYEGIDVLFTTPKRLNELINNTGVPLVNLKMLIIDDGETIFKNQNHTIIYRIVDSLDKVQVVMYANNWHSKFDDFAERAMKNPQVININEG